MEADREPGDVSQRTEGYDIVSKDKRGRMRFIEVKSRRGGTKVTLTQDEFATAQEKGKRYYVYVVRGDGSIRIIRDPAQTCEIDEVFVREFEIVDWVEKGTAHNVTRS